MIPRQLRLLLPTAAAILTRLIQFAVLVILAARGPADVQRDVLVAGFGVLGAFAILTDSGAANFLLSTKEPVSHKTFRRVLLQQLTLGLLGGALALGFVFLSTEGKVLTKTILILTAIACSQVFEGTLRAIRAPLLVARRDERYASVDLFLFVMKLPIILAALATGQIEWLLALPVVSLTVAIATIIQVGPLLVQHGRSPERLTLKVLEFGVTGALSALYSQSPMLIGTLVLPIHQVAALSIVYRLVQPLEVVPGTLAQQLTPRVRTRQNGPWSYWLIFGGLGLVAAACLTAFRPILEIILGGQFQPDTIFLIIAASMPFKWGNYSLVSYAMGMGLVRYRLLVTSIVGLVASMLCVILSQVGGAPALALVTILGEVMLTVGLMATFARHKKRTHGGESDSA